MALEFAPYLTVNSVAPGWTNTDMNAGIPEEDIPGELERIALKRYCEPIEIANVVYFLSTEEADCINGEIIRVDGGMI